VKTVPQVTLRLTAGPSSIESVGDPGQIKQTTPDPYGSKQDGT
jgi:hypothetical protein